VTDYREISMSSVSLTKQSIPTPIWHAVAHPEVLDQLRASTDGLTEDEATLRNKRRCKQ
jgi:hypothetical protein